MAAQLTAKRVSDALHPAQFPKRIGYRVCSTRPADMSVRVILIRGGFAELATLALDFPRIEPLATVVATIRAAAEAFAGGSSPEPAPRRHFRDDAEELKRRAWPSGA